MNLQIVEQKKNQLLSRKEIRARLSYEQATPSNDELKKQLATAMKVGADVLSIQHIYPAYGDKKAEVMFNVYDSAEIMKKVEPEKKPKKAAAQKKEEKADE
jgi:ribosomal protein S24E